MREGGLSRSVLLMRFHYRYYSGQKIAPILTIVIGGNHEASNYFWELCVRPSDDGDFFTADGRPQLTAKMWVMDRYHGGWLAPNIYYLGCAGVVQFNGIRIAGASGIYKYHDYRLGMHDCPDF